MANMDFTKRKIIHYHAIVVFKPNTRFNDFRNLYKYGNIDFEQCTFNNEEINYKTALALSKYLNKLTNHALKESTNKKIIYSRCNPNNKRIKYFKDKNKKGYKYISLEEYYFKSMRKQQIYLNSLTSIKLPVLISNIIEL